MTLMPMPDAIRKLITTGVVYPTDPENHGKPMTCAFCGAPVMIHYRPDPVDLSKLGHRDVLPMLRWGEEVDVICMCCSFPLDTKCTHRGANEVAA